MKRPAHLAIVKNKEPYALVSKLRKKAKTMLDNPDAVLMLEAAEMIEECADRAIAAEKRLAERRAGNGTTQKRYAP